MIEQNCIQPHVKLEIMEGRAIAKEVLNGWYEQILTYGKNPVCMDCRCEKAKYIIHEINSKKNSPDWLWCGICSIGM